jgi:isopentenyl-diphosphate delta-isomerase
MTEYLWRIDEDDNPIDKVTREEAHEKGLLHRCVHVFVFNDKGELYVGQRSSEKEKLGGYWDALSEHVEYGESYEEAALRGLTEEYDIRINEEELKFVSDERIRDSGENLKYRLFTVTCNEPVRRNDETAQGGFYPLEDVRNKIHSNELNFCPWFLQSFNRIANRK